MASIISDSCGIGLEEIRIIGNPLDPEYLGQLPNSTEHNFPRNTVLYMGRLENRKGAFVFARAIPIIHRARPDTHFVFAGPDRRSPNGGSSREEIESFLTKSGVDVSHVIFLGHVPRSKLKACYSEPTVIVIPSLYEDYPYAVIEAMACGAPVVASDCYGIPEIIQHGVTGLLAKTGDSADFAEQIMTLLENPSQRCQIAEAGREFVLAECAPQRAASLTVQVYLDTIESCKPKNS